ncbi:MAG TPA: LegC family aminotransferase [Bryobacteraceae bacterium]
MSESAITTRYPISLCAPQLQGNEWTYVKECLDTGWVSSVGSYVIRFEEMMARRLRARHAIATSCGTAALHAALLVAGVKPDEEVLVSDLTFIAPANAVRYLGAFPVFIDVDNDFWQMDVERLQYFLETRCVWRDAALFNRVTGRRVRAIIPVHILGHPVCMKPLLELAHKYGLVVVEDATESLGALYDGQHVGHLGDIGCFSFNGNKLITTGGGGMIVTDNEEWAQRARHLTTQAKADAWEYIHSDVGFNYRLTNIQAALGVAQMEVLDSYVESKRDIAGTYENAFQSLPGIYPMQEAPWARSVYWMYTVLVEEAEYGVDSRTLMRSFASADIQTRPLWQPLHLSPAHAGCQVVGGEVAEQLWRKGLSLPCSVGLTSLEQERVVDMIRSQRKHHLCSEGSNLLMLPRKSARRGYLPTRTTQA